MSIQRNYYMIVRAVFTTGSQGITNTMVYAFLTESFSAFRHSSTSPIAAELKTASTCLFKHCGYLWRISKCYQAYANRETALSKYTLALN